MMDKKHIMNSPLSINGEIINDNHKKTDLFNVFFIKQSSMMTQIYVSLIDFVFCNTSIPTKMVKSSESFKMLNTINVHKETGPDKIELKIIESRTGRSLNCLTFVFAQAFSQTLGSAHMSFIYIKMMINSL